MNYSVYIHIPFCVSKCLYCDFYSRAQTIIADCYVPNSYIDAILNEIDYRFFNLTKHFTSNENKIKTVYIGGGTPSLLNEEQILKIHNYFVNKNVFTDDYEFTIEVNPDDVTEEYINILKSTCVNRISCGIQTLNQKSLDFVKRRGTVEDNLRALKLFSSQWNKNFSVDLICGLPYETEQSFFEALNKIVLYNPNHISMYSLTFEENTPITKLLDSGNLEYNFDFADELWLNSKNFLENHNFLQYEVSNFSKKGFESKHNLAYWNHQSYFGIGSGATGTFYLETNKTSNNDNINALNKLSCEQTLFDVTKDFNCKKGLKGIRWVNTKNVENYIDFWTDKNNLAKINQYKFQEFYNQNYKIQEVEFIDFETSKFEYFLMGLRKMSGINSKEFELIFNCAIDSKIIHKFNEWNKKGLCEITNLADSVQYTLGKNGILYLNKFLEELI